MSTTAAPPALTPTSRSPWTAPRGCITAVVLAGLTFLLALDLVYQLTATTRASAPLPYVLLGALDGFIALAIAAIVRLRQASIRDEEYAWGLAVAAVVVRAITIAVLHSLADQQGPGGPWTLADILVLAMSASAPLIPLGAVHLYVLAAEHAARVAQQRGPTVSQQRLQGGDA
ncbi:hypothetical protein [Streptomyces sp. NPDC051561]|uniref:hypothetical protein n=1 Tax=Streptomyces sp. NPDC051561 TaxID=3365658 RepID=UPI0037B0BE81